MPSLVPRPGPEAALGQVSLALSLADWLAGRGCCLSGCLSVYLSPGAPLFFSCSPALFRRNLPEGRAELDALALADQAYDQIVDQAQDGHGEGLRH